MNLFQAAAAVVSVIIRESCSALSRGLSLLFLSVVFGRFVVQDSDKIIIAPSILDVELLFAFFPENVLLISFCSANVLHLLFWVCLVEIKSYRSLDKPRHQ